MLSLRLATAVHRGYTDQVPVCWRGAAFHHRNIWFNLYEKIDRHSTTYFDVRELNLLTAVRYTPPRTVRRLAGRGSAVDHKADRLRHLSIYASLSQPLKPTHCTDPHHVGWLENWSSGPECCNNLLLKTVLLVRTCQKAAELLLWRKFAIDFAPRPRCLPTSSAAGVILTLPPSAVQGCTCGWDNFN